MINATKKWIFLKISSILLTPLMLWFAISLASFYDKNYDEVLLFFTEQGRVYTITAFETPEASRQATGRAIKNIIELIDRMNGWQFESFKESYEHKIKTGISIFKKNQIKK